jgi:hypothetical protein
VASSGCGRLAVTYIVIIVGVSPIEGRNLNLGLEPKKERQKEKMDSQAETFSPNLGL